MNANSYTGRSAKPKPTCDFNWSIGAGQIMANKNTFHFLHIRLVINREIRGYWVTLAVTLIKKKIKKMQKINPGGYSGCLCVRLWSCMCVSIRC